MINRSKVMPNGVVITGIGMITPLGNDPEAVLRRVEAGESAAAAPTGFDASLFACPVCAEVKDFQPEQFIRETKMLRLMNRDAQFAVAAAHLALRDAGLTVGKDYAPDEIALFGATGMAGLPLAEVAPLARASTTPDGHFDLERFGKVGLRSINPLLSFKILANMPLCFVSICENIQGPNAIYTPWEGQGTHAIEAGIRAVECGDASCALVGGCDVKTHELAFISLDQQGLFESWKSEKQSVIPGEGSVFLVLEKEGTAQHRKERIYGRVRWVQYRLPTDSKLIDIESGQLQLPHPLNGFVAAEESGDISPEAVRSRLRSWLLPTGSVIFPKRYAGNLYAAAAPLQVGLGALVAYRQGGLVFADCLLDDRNRTAFFVEKP